MGVERPARVRLHATNRLDVFLIDQQPVTKDLELLPDGWQMLRDRRQSPTSPTTIDHVVVGPTGVHVIAARTLSCGTTLRTAEAASLAEVRGLLRRELAQAGCGAPVRAVSHPTPRRSVESRWECLHPRD